MGARWLGAVVSSLMYIDNKKKDMLIHGKGPKNGSNDTILNAKKEDSIKCLIVIHLLMVLTYANLNKKNWIQMQLHYV